MKSNKQRQFISMIIMLVSISFLTLIVSQLKENIAEARPLGPTDHIEEDDILIWQSLSDYLANDFAIDPLNNENIYIATDYPTAVAFSHDYGATWITRSVGANSYENGLAIAIDPVSPNYLYLGVTDDRIYRSADSGNSWTRVDGGVSGGERVSEMYVHPVTPTLVFGGSYSGTPTVFRSTNRGNSWTAIPLVPGPANDRVDRIFSVATIPNRMYAVVDLDVYISEDAGLTWDLASFIAVDLAVAHDDPNLMYRLSNDCRAYISVNGGMNWTVLPQAESVCYQGIHLDPTDSDIVYLTSQYRHVARSLDGGQTWQILTGRDNAAPYAWAFAIDPADPTRLYVAQGVWVAILFDNESYIPAVFK